MLKTYTYVRSNFLATVKKPPNLLNLSRKKKKERSQEVKKSRQKSRPETSSITISPLNLLFFAKVLSLSVYYHLKFFNYNIKFTNIFRTKKIKQEH